MYNIEVLKNSYFPAVAAHSNNAFLLPDLPHFLTLDTNIEQAFYDIASYRAFVPFIRFLLYNLLHDLFNDGSYIEAPNNKIVEIQKSRRLVSSHIFVLVGQTVTFFQLLA